ncbi:MAG TPA: aldolase catalytic domain-containing protein [Candidatus Hydrogenedentes bacterium]|nr:aldolase catalytic domain-containing protein [Candidatus Hydrogenedentota bacterium]HQH50903.1 aldolase catalytic domain-containing protein [Candidatus Hydrogenedentota bacterium]
MYRPEIKVLDCTIRDGGLMNDWRFSKAMVKDVFAGLAQAGIDYVELGYRADKQQFSKDDFGPWRFCDEEDLRETVCQSDARLAVMADVGRTDYNDIVPASESLIRLYRVATYVKDIQEAICLGDHCKKQGYEVSINIMAVSHALEPDLDRALDKLAGTDFDMVYLVDSFGYLQPHQIEYMAHKYLAKLPGKQIGIHCHNNQQLAFANTVEAAMKGITCLDGSIYGIGRAAGNCPLELIIGFLKNPKFDVRPVLDLIERYLIPLKKDLKWGYEIPYVITGLLNKHPRAAMAFMDTALNTSLRSFYDELSNLDDI